VNFRLEAEPDAALIAVPGHGHLVADIAKNLQNGRLLPML